jgi:ACS family tartrate transporter-like MFS transporter
MDQAILAPEPTEFAERTRRKISRRLLPFLLLLYTIAYLDRANLSYASLEMTKELHFSNAVYGLGGGIFFLGYWFLEIPGAILVERWSARKWISRIMLSWGLAAALTGLIHTRSEFYWARFLLGVAEAGFFPGVVVYLTHWFRAADRAKAVAGLLVGIPISQIVGSPLSAALMHIHWFAWSGWRWLLILEGAPAIVAGAWAFFYLTDRPRNAKWLTVEEQDWITSELEREKSSLASKEQAKVWRVIFQPQVLVLTAIWFFSLCAGNAFILWMPKIVQRMSGYSPVFTTLVSAIPYLAALPFTLLVGWNSDRTGERRWHTAGCLFLAAGGLAMSLATDNIPIGIFALTLAAMGINGPQPPFWSVSSSMLAGTSSAVAIAVISSFGQLGGFAGPYIVGFLTDRTGTYAAATFYLIGCDVIAAFLMLGLKHANRTPAR